jgi:hypothetical protein
VEAQADSGHVRRPHIIASDGSHRRRWLARVSIGILSAAIAGSGGGLALSQRASASPPILLAASLPATPAGKQLAWLLQGTVHPPANPQAIVVEHFDQAFLQQIPANQLVATIADLNGPTGMHLVRLTQESPSALVALVKETRSELTVSLSVDGAGLIDGLFFRPAAPPPTSWAALRRQLSSVAPDVSFSAAQVTGTGQCRTVYSDSATTPRPLGSMFKLFVLGAVAKQVQAQRVSWTQPIVIQDDLKSLPSGVLQNDPDGTSVTVDQAATGMISISDNTAADLLISLVGRAAVERQVDLWSSNSSLDSPFLDTRELFILKYGDFPVLAHHYLSLRPARRSAYLADTIDKAPLPTIAEISREPRDIDSLEWFASADDICRAFAGLSELSTKPGLSALSTVLSANDGGLGLDPTTWPTVWFKGGSEPGVFTLGYLARDSQGRTFVVTALASNPRSPIDGGWTLVLSGLIRSAFNLLG